MGPYNRLFLPALGWLILCTVLLTIPGDSLPGDHWIDIPMFDKWIHIGLFSIMAALICRWLLKKGITRGKEVRYFILCGLVCLAYGIIMEFVQKYWVPLRSFDSGDIVADGVGSALGVIYSVRVYIKK